MEAYVIRSVMGIVLGFALLVPMSALADQPATSGDTAVKIVDTIYRWKGGASSPLEMKLRAKLEEMSANEQGGSAGGFEPPPEDKNAGQPVGDDDGQFNALKEVIKDKQPLERVKACVWYLVIRPRTAHRDEVMGMINQHAAALSPAQQGEFRDYMEVRKSLSGASYGARVDRWEKYTKEKASSAFAELANREIQHIKSVQADTSAEKRKGAGRFFVKIGIVAIVLALVAVIVLGAAK